jgi:hypothetical protein
MAPQSDLVLVVGSTNSSNSNRLREVAELLKVPAYLVDNADAIDPAWISGRQRIGVTAGASAPEVLVESVIARLKELGAGSVRQLEGVPERVTFPLPKSCRSRTEPDRSGPFTLLHPTPELPMPYVQRDSTGQVVAIFAQPGPGHDEPCPPATPTSRRSPAPLSSPTSTPT